MTTARKRLETNREKFDKAIRRMTLTNKLYRIGPEVLVYSINGKLFWDQITPSNHDIKTGRDVLKDGPGGGRLTAYEILEEYLWKEREEAHETLDDIFAVVENTSASELTVTNKLFERYRRIRRPAIETVNGLREHPKPNLEFKMGNHAALLMIKRNLKWYSNNTTNELSRNNPGNDFYRKARDHIGKMMKKGKKSEGAAVVKRTEELVSRYGNK